MKLKLKYGLCCIALSALLGATASCNREPEKVIPDLEYAYTPDGTSFSYPASLNEFVYTSGNVVIPIASGGNVTLTALMTPYNVTFPEIVWISGDESVATTSYPEDGVATVQGTEGVTNDGVITATGTVGTTTTITVTPPQNVSNLPSVKSYFDVRVVSVLTRTTSIAFDCSDSEALVAGAKLEIAASTSPETAVYGDEVLWSTSDKAVATVKDGVVTAVAAGSATITATSLDGSMNDTAVSKSITITVTE